MSSGPSKRIRKLLRKYLASAFEIKAPRVIHDRPIHGTTVYLATCEVEMTYGHFTAYIFQDIIHKGYVIALSYGDIKRARTLYTRVHSSCVTSETLRGCDCDCVEQLNGAMELIAKKGKGILFYLLQEGRGVGYVAKARDRMLVQACEDEISTFEAYEHLGLRRDYRQYRNIKPICIMLGINPEFVLLTNNPDKVSALKELGVRLKRTETLEYEPSVYNLAYLKSKMDAGHFLAKPDVSELRRIHTPEPVKLFKPHALKNAQRFIYAASYYLPIRPISSNIIISEREYKRLFKARTVDAYVEDEVKLIKSCERLRKKRYKVRIDARNLKAHAKEHPDDLVNTLLHTPYWFRVHVYFDIVTDEDFVVLTYGKPTKADSPVVRIQSESLFNRFPVKDPANREKYKSAVEAITNYGSGAILLLYSDGRGGWIGAYAQDRMFKERGLTANTRESYNKLGVNFDLRDYEAAMMLLKEHIPSTRKVQMVMNSPSSLVSKTAYTEALNELGITVDRWIFLEDQRPTYDLL